MSWNDTLLVVFAGSSWQEVEDRKKGVDYIHIANAAQLDAFSWALLAHPLLRYLRQLRVGAELALPAHCFLYTLLPCHSRLAIQDCRDSAHSLVLCHNRDAHNPAAVRDSMRPDKTRNTPHCRILHKRNHPDTAIHSSHTHTQRMAGSDIVAGENLDLSPPV